MVSTLVTTPSAAELLRRYLPERDGRTPGERLQAIAGRAFIDGCPRIERRLHTTLLPEERHDARSTLVYVGLKCALTYDSTLDRGTGVVPLEIRFGRFAYMRMRLALIDWERKTFGDRRPGRTRHPEMLELVDYNDELDAGAGLGLEELNANRAQLAQWVRASGYEGKTLSTWIVDTLDNASTRSHARQRARVRRGNSAPVVGSGGNVTASTSSASVLRVVSSDRRGRAEELEAP
jgi:hypothetical protein